MAGQAQDFEVDHNGPNVIKVVADKDEPIVDFATTPVDDSGPTKVFVTNVPYDFDETGLAAEFGKHGVQVQKVTLYRAQRRHRGIGCVVVHPDDYDQALELSGKIPVRHGAIGVEPFKPKYRHCRAGGEAGLHDGEAFFSVTVTLIEWSIVQLFRTLRNQGMVHY
ncbi:hypothetical protein B0H14DRAFT_3024345 [Mycena olivaceomarginata]|nr:hypothetical protein B0H14DRAFT_3024345 [Mycena olivaceomarginata]